MPTGRKTAIAIGAAVAFLLLILFAGTGYDYAQLEGLSAGLPPAADSAAVDLKRLRAENRRLSTALRKTVPRQTYVVVDQANNRLYLRRDGKVLLTAVCSSGSGMVLRDVKGDRHWVFDTPRGRFTVRSRAEDPVWRKPDWAFIEAGEPIPADPADRIEYGTLGEYAMYLGDGYMIHGTLYERLLGRSVTHGCIRLGREDLATVWRSTKLGTPVFIY